MSAPEPPGFEHDVFISYAHIDDAKLGDGRDGWITAFHQDLAVMLGQEFGRRPRIFRDAKLHGNTDFSGMLDGAVKESAAIVSVVSNRYVGSDWCQRELDGFINLAEADIGAKVGTQSRVFPVLINQIDEWDLPPTLNKFLGYRFFQADEASGRAKRLDRRFGSDFEQAYYAVLSDLAEDLGKLQRTLASNQPRQAADWTDKSVFLALTSQDRFEVRDRLAREFKGLGHIMLPEGPLPEPGTVAFEKAIRGYLDRSDLAIHLIGKDALANPDLGLAAVEAQARIGANMSITQDLANLFWVDPQVDLAAPTGQGAGFLAWLRDEAARGKRVDVLQTHVEELESVAQDWLAPRGRAGGRRGRIWVAEPTYDLRPARERLIRQLGAGGMSTLTPVDVPYTSAYPDRVASMLSGAEVAVHVVGRSYGLVPEGLDQSIQELQTGVVDRAREEGIPQVVWIPEAGEARDAKQQAFLNTLREAGDGMHVVEGPGAGPVMQLIAELTAPEPEPDSPEAASDVGPLAVYVLFEEIDFDAVAPLSDLLFDAEVDELKPLLDGTPEEVREQHEENLAEADAIIVFHGGTGERWLNVQLRELKKAPAVRDGRELPTLILVGPPDDKHKKRIRVRGAEIVHAEAGIDAAPITAFLSTVRSRRSA